MKKRCNKKQKGFTLLNNPAKAGLPAGHSTGFTLIELLIAASIFAATIVLIVGSFGISTKNQRQVKVNRDISQDINSVTQEIADQIEYSFNGPLKDTGGTVTQGGKNVYNFAVLTSLGSVIAAPDNSISTYLLVRGADNHCRYYRTVPDNTVDGHPHRVAVWIDKDEGCDNPHWGNPYYLTSPDVDVTSLQFKGVMNTVGKANQQAFVWIMVQSKNNQATNPEFNIPLNTDTLATIRNYNREQ